MYCVFPFSVFLSLFFFFHLFGKCVYAHLHLTYQIWWFTSFFLFNKICIFLYHLHNTIWFKMEKGSLTHFNKSSEVYFYPTYLPQENVKLISGGNACLSIQRKRMKRQRVGKARRRERRRKCSEITYLGMSESP